MRQIVLDTETTGIDPASGHRLIEIGCVELVNRKLTGNTYHQYINPQRVVEDEAIQVHGITNEFLADKPVFANIVDDFIAFVRGAELVIHNAPFDIGFINHELKRDGSRYGRIDDICGVVDTLVMARQKHPGQRNSLDALCKRYGIDNSHRLLHGALLDSEILADVYLLMTGGQTGLELGGNHQENPDVEEEAVRPANGSGLKVVRASTEETAAHEAYLQLLQKKSDGQCIWLADGGS